MLGKIATGMAIVILLSSLNVAYAATSIVEANSPLPYGDFMLLAPPPTEWNKTYGGTRSELAYSMVQIDDGGYAITGFVTYPGWASFLLVRTDADGNMQWMKTYGEGSVNNHEDNYAFSVVQTSDGGYAMAGFTASEATGYYTDFRLVKTDAYGNMQWNKTYGGAGDDWAYSVVQTTDGGYAMAGYTESFGAGSTDFWLVKVASEPSIAATVIIHPEGLHLWSRGHWITAYIELPQGYNVDDIDVSTIRLNDSVLAQPHPATIGDYDNDTVPDLMVKFDRASVIGIILNYTDIPPKFRQVALTITGKLQDKTPFKGSCNIKTIYITCKRLRAGIFAI
jgi:hypothetical protein